MAAPRLRDNEFQVETITVKCFRCGANTKVTIEKGTRPPPMMRYYCKTGLRPNVADDGSTVTMSRESWSKMRRRLSKTKIKPKNLKVYRPGDEEFKSIAKTNTPIRDIEYERHNPYIE